MFDAQCPLVSIVLPTYNGARYLAQSIESCINQTYTQWELIIVDDASTDDTPAIISHYVQLDSRIRTVRHSTNRKLPAALNTGFDMARGEYFTWTSDDNYYRPEALGVMVAFLESRADVDLVYTDFTRVDEQDRLISHAYVLQPEYLLDRNIVGPSFLYRSLLHTTLNGYSEEFFLVEDYDFWLRTSLHHKLEPLHKDLYCLRKHRGALGATHRDRVREILLDVKGRHLPQIQWAKSKQKSNAYIKMAKEAWHLDRPMQSYRYLILALSQSPQTFMARIIAGGRSRLNTWPSSRSRG